MISTAEHPRPDTSDVEQHMERLSKAQITARLGREPEAWDFRGQCFDVGEGLHRVCALTEQPTRFCFTLKPKVGKGRVVIGPSAFAHLRRFAPVLFMKLERGRQFLQVSVEAEQSDAVQAGIAKRVSQSEKRFVSLKIEARKRLRAYRMAIRRGELPEYLASLRALLERPEPKFETPEAKSLWCDQGTTDFEQQLIQSKPDGSPAEKQPLRIDRLPEATVASTETKRRTRREKLIQPNPANFDPIPEIQF